jgi:hypothetical protein
VIRVVVFSITYICSKLILTFRCIECCLRCVHLKYTHTYKDIPLPSFAATELVPFVDLFKLSTEKKNNTKLLNTCSVSFIIVSMKLVEQELLTLTEHLSSPPVISRVTRK